LWGEGCFETILLLKFPKQIFSSDLHCLHHVDIIVMNFFNYFSLFAQKPWPHCSR